MRANALLLAAGLGAVTSPALAEGGIAVKPLVDARLRYERVDQHGFSRDADALTARVRAGVEAGAGPVSLLGEVEATLAAIEHYNSGTNGRALYPVVADPQNVELNRLQLQYRAAPDLLLIAGRQRINLDDQRFVGSVGWRQNEQTFDAVRIEARKLGPITADLTYAWSNRTIWGIEAQDLPSASPNKQAIGGGDNLFANAGATLGPVTAKGFAYLVDQDEPGRRRYSSQTYGLRLASNVSLGTARLDLAASYARQSDWQDNPIDYAADYWLVEGKAALAGFDFTAGYEVLGADDGGSLQTPLATLHKFNGTADKFLTTPPAGLRDLYLGIGGKWPKLVPGLAASVTWHRFDSDRLGLSYGEEWDAQIGFRLGPTGILLKYASYDRIGAADFPGDADTDKLWFQIEWTV